MSGFPTRIAFEEAHAIVRSVGQAHRQPIERIAVARAHGRVLAQDVVAAIALPPFDNSAMDGFAFRHADLPDGAGMLLLAGEQFAGLASGQVLGPGECVRITTGAPLPAGADVVVMKENTRLHGDRVHVLEAPKPGQHVRRAGEDAQPGERVLASGTRLSPARIALACALGLAELEVSRAPTVAVFTTGDELVEPGLPLQPGQIHNSNRDMLMGLLRAHGLEPTAWPNLPDDPGRMRSALLDAAAGFDLILTCGGVSAGEKDHVPALLQQAGRVAFWKVRMRPGMPLLFGTLGDACLLGLPGNPVSVLATWLTLGRALVDAMQGHDGPDARWFARLQSPWTKHHDRLEFLRGRLMPSTDGTLWVQPHPADGSHRMRGAAQSDALIVLEAGREVFPAGQPVEILRY